MFSYDTVSAQSADMHQKGEQPACTGELYAWGRHQRIQGEGRGMQKFQWTDNLGVGVTMIDDDHRVLIDQINMLSDAVGCGGDEILTASVLNILIDYTDYHFGREQQLMENLSYPDMDPHVQEHRLLVKKVKEIRGDYQRGKALDNDVLTFLKVWLTQHIEKSDQAFGVFLKARGAARLIPPRKMGAVNWSDLSVLVVDDQFNFRSLLRSILSSLGVRKVREARDGDEALQMLAAEPADLVLTDDDMSPMDGVEFTRRVRCSKGSPDPRTLIIVMPSKEVTRDSLMAFTQAGVHDLLAKPLATTAIQTRVERHLISPLPFQEINGMLIPMRQKVAPASAHA